jgi:peptidoglycan hydrolase CwlO-like protein
VKWLEWLLAPWLRTPRQVRDLWEFVLDETDLTTETLLRNEAHMSEIDNALSELDAATNEVAAELDALEATVAGLDADAGAKIRAAADKLRGLAADPANPVPAEPAPADEAPVAEPVADTNDEGEPPAA